MASDLEYFVARTNNLKATHQMLLEPLPESDWLIISDSYSERMAHKSNLLQQDCRLISAHLPDSQKAQQEALQMIYNHLQKWYAHKFTLHGEQVCCPDMRYQSLDTGAALAIAGRLVEEDLCLMQADRNGNWKLTAATIAMPSRWWLKDKIGQDLATIHAPVKGLQQQLGKSMQYFFEHLNPERIFVRGNWFLHSSPDWFLPADSKLSNHDIDMDSIGKSLFFRCERQTLRRLPESNAILFSIRVTVDPLDCLESDHMLAIKIHKALEDDGIRNYRAHSIVPVHGLLMTYLGRLVQDRSS